MRRRSYKGLDEFGSAITIGDVYLNDAYDDAECKNKHYFYRYIFEIKMNVLIVLVDEIAKLFS